MDLFLQETKNKLINLSRYQKIHVVIGNEACDLDSTVSALVYAYFLDKKNPVTENVAYVPVLNIPRKVFRLRTEVTYILNRLAISDANLTFRDEIDLHDLYSQNRLSLSLVDHHVLQQKDADLDSCVVEVIDHRSNQRGDGDDNCRVTIEMVGSCTTLVTERIVESDISVLTEDIATLLLGTIVLDTVNFDPLAGKTTSKDESMAEQLERQFPVLDKKELYESLQSAKCDVSGLETDEILLKDLKCLSNDVIKIAFCSIALHLEEFLQREGIIEDLRRFCITQCADIIVIMAISIDEGNISRQLGIFAHHHGNVKQDLIFRLECSINPDLDLSPMVTGFDEISTYHQGNVKASRKKAMPIFNEFLESMDTDSVKKTDIASPSSDLMDLDSDTLSAKSSGVSDLPSEPTTATNTPVSPQHRSMDLLGFDPYGTAPPREQNDNANNNAITDHSPEFFSPTGASDDSGFDPLQGSSPVSKTPDLTSSTPNIFDDIIANQEGMLQETQAMFGAGDLPLKSKPDGQLFSQGELLEFERNPVSLPVPIPKSSESGNENTTLSPMVPLTPQNSYSSLSDAELSEIGGTRQKSVDLSNPDVAYAVHERLREVEEEENFDFFSQSNTENRKSDAVDCVDDDMADNIVATMLASDMAAENRTEHIISDNGNDNVVRNDLTNENLANADSTTLDALPSAMTGSENDGPIDYRVKNPENCDETIFYKKDLADFKYNVIAKAIADEMNQEKNKGNVAEDQDQKTVFFKKNLRDFKFNVVAKAIADDMDNEKVLGSIAEDRDLGIVFYKKDLSDFKYNVVAKAFADDMNQEKDLTISSLTEGDQKDQKNNKHGEDIAEDEKEDTTDFNFVKKDLTNFRYNAVAAAIAEDIAKDEEEIRLAKRELTGYGDNVIAKAIAEDMGKNGDGTSIVNDLSNSVVAGGIAEEMSRGENSVYINQSEKIASAEGEEIDEMSKLFEADVQNNIDRDFTFAKREGGGDNIVAEMIAEEMQIEAKHITRFAKRDAVLGSKYYNIVAKSIAEDMKADDDNRTNFPKTDINLKLATFNAVADMLAGEMKNGENCQFKLPEEDLLPQKDNVLSKVLSEDVVNESETEKELSSLMQDLTSIAPSARSRNISAYMLAYTSMDETGDSAREEGDTTPGEDSVVENGDHNSPNNETADSTHPEGNESANGYFEESFVPIDQPATNNPVTMADIEKHQEETMFTKRVSSPSMDSESQTSGDEASTTSGSFSCNEYPSPVHHTISSIAEIEEPVSEEDNDVMVVEIATDKKVDVIERDIMEEERVVIGQEADSVAGKIKDVKVEDVPSIQNGEVKSDNSSLEEFPARTRDDIEAAQTEAVARYLEKYVDEDEEKERMRSLKLAESVAKASPRKKNVSQASIDAEERMAGVKLNEEWQDDDDIMQHHADIGEDWIDDVIEIDITDPVPPMDDVVHNRPTSLDLGAKPKTKKKVSPPAELKITDNDGGSTPSDSFDMSRFDDMPTPDMQTPSLRDDSSILMTSGEMEWEDDTPLPKTTSAERIPEYTAEEEKKDNRHWRVVDIGGKNYNMDMKVIQPYKKVLAHGGYYGDGLNAIIVFAACYLPEKTRKDYSYVMDNLFLYVISTLDLLVAQDYMIIYFHGGCNRHQAPNLGWLKRCYRMIDRRLRKNLKALLLTHPNLWLKTVVRFSKPFISSKFSRKLRFVSSLAELKQLVSLEYVYVPEQVKLFDEKKRKKKN